MSYPSTSFLTNPSIKLFEQKALKDWARDRQRWLLGVPLIIIALGGLLVINQKPEVPETQA